MPYTGQWLSAGHNAERSDIVISHVDAGQVCASGVSLRGYGHLANGQPLQDAHAVGQVPDSPLLIALVADGSGRYTHSHWLSEILARSGWRYLSNQLSGNQELPTNGEELAAQLRDLALYEGRRMLAYLNGLKTYGESYTPEDVAKHMACTLQLVMVNTESLEYQWINVAGDSSVYRRNKAGTLQVVHQGSDENGKNRWTPPLPHYDGAPMILGGRLDAGDMLLLVTDGIGEALLDGTTPESLSVASRLSTRPTVFNIASFISTIGVNDTDDKTMVLITTG